MLGLEKRLEVMYGMNRESGEDAQSNGKRADGGVELGKIGLALSCLAILLIVGLYLSHDMRISSIQSDLNDKLSAMQGVDARVGAVEKRLVAIEGLPEMARKMYVNTAIADIKQRATALTGMASEEQKAALTKVEDILAGLQKDMK